MRPVDDAAVEKFLTDLLTTSHVPYPEQLKFAVRGHVQDLLKTYRSLYVSAKHFMGQDGRPYHVIAVEGTIPIRYKDNNTYNIPVSFMLLTDYPRAGPICKVEPSADMALVANHPHVDVNGFIVNLPYLARWTFPSHTLIELAAELALVFAQRSPVYSKPPGAPAAVAAGPAAGAAHALHAQGAPGHHLHHVQQGQPGPAGWAAGAQHMGPGVVAGAQGAVQPPPPPPPSQQPPPPPLPPHQQQQPGSYGGRQGVTEPSPAHYGVSTSGGGMVAGGPAGPQAGPHPIYGFQQPMGYGPGQPGQPPPPPPPPPPTQPPPPPPPPPPPTHTPETVFREHAISALAERSRDILDMILGIQHQQKDALLATQATLTQRNRTLVTALGPLRAEREGLERHISALEATSVALDSWLMENEGRVPEAVDVDAAFQAETPLGRQLLENAADDSAIEDTLDCLERALNAGTLGLDLYIRLVRQLSREQFLARAVCIEAQKRLRGSGGVHVRPLPPPPPMAARG